VHPPADRVVEFEGAEFRWIEQRGGDVPHAGDGVSGFCKKAFEEAFHGRGSRGPGAPEALSRDESREQGAGSRERL